MPSQTLAEAAKLINNQIVQGVVEDILSINPIFDVLPFTPYSGQSISYNRENALGDVQNLAVGGTITAKAPATFTKVSFSAVTIIGDAEMNGLVQAQSQGAGVDQLALEVSSKAKSISRAYQQGMATGTGSDPQMNSLHSMVDASMYTSASAGQALSFALLDELLDLPKSKGGQVDFLMAPARTIRSYLALLRALGGVTIGEVQTFAQTGRRTTPNLYVTYRGIPFYQNDFLSVVETANGAALTGGALTSVWAGCLDDGTGRAGLTGIYPAASPAGVAVERVGALEARDETITRVKWYTNLALMNRRALARLPSINN